MFSHSGKVSLWDLDGPKDRPSGNRAGFLSETTAFSFTAAKVAGALDLSQCTSKEGPCQRTPGHWEGAATDQRWCSVIVRKNDRNRLKHKHHM